MKTLKLTIVALLLTVSAFAQKHQVITKVLPCFDPMSVSYANSPYKVIDSLKKQGYKVTGMYRITGTKTCKWTLIK